MNKTDYDNQLIKILSDKRKFVKRKGNSFGQKKSKDITLFREEQLQRYLYSLFTKGVLDEEVYHSMYPSGSIPARIYGLPKIHKLSNEDRIAVPPVIPCFRPIISSIGAYNYDLAKYLTKILSPHIPTRHCAKDTFSFVEDLKEVSYHNKHLVSFDVVSLFTNIPLHKTINMAVDIIFANDKSIKMSKAQLKKLFLFATSQNHFLFQGQYYDQIDGVAMGSPLGPVLANLFMGVMESRWLNEYSGPSVLFYRRFVDDIFCVFENRSHANAFLRFLNRQHPNIKFTVEHENEGTLPFLDVLIRRTENGDISTTTYRKPTNTGLLTNFTSFTAFSYKTGLIKTLIDRAFKINSSLELRKIDLSFITNTLQKNMFPKYLIDRAIDSYSTVTASDVVTSAPKETRYYKIPYVGKFSTIAKKKVNELVEKYCTETVDVKFIFMPFKVGQYFSNKDPVPAHNISNVIYKFCCANCNVCYIGETARHFVIRKKEHLSSDQSSAVYKHIHDVENGACKAACNNDCFTILDRAPTKYQLRIKEGLLIRRDQPILNIQVKSYNPGLL